MLCKIWGIHGGDYEDFRLLRYKAPVRFSQETYHVSGTESSRLMLCKILGFHGGNCEECRLILVSTNVSENRIASIRVTKIEGVGTTLAVTITLFLARRYLSPWLRWWYFPPKFGYYKSNTASHHRRRHSSYFIHISNDILVPEFFSNAVITPDFNNKYYFGRISYIMNITHSIWQQETSKPNKQHAACVLTIPLLTTPLHTSK
jgi:hypothetical protein